MYTSFSASFQPSHPSTPPSTKGRLLSLSISKHLKPAKPPSKSTAYLSIIVVVLRGGEGVLEGGGAEDVDGLDLGTVRL